MAKIGTLSLVSRVPRAPIIKILMFITKTRQDLTTKKDFMRKYQKLAELFAKTLENRGFLVYHPSRERPLELIKFRKSLQKLPKRILIRPTQKKSFYSNKEGKAMDICRFSSLFLRRDSENVFNFLYQSDYLISRCPLFGRPSAQTPI